MRIYGNAYGEEVAGASRARPLRRRLASRMRTPGKTPGQQTGARRFSHVFTNHDARQHNVITFTPPTKPMIAESGFYTNVKGNKFPRLQILTIEDLHSGKVRAEHPDYEPDLILPRVKICGTVFWRKNGVKIFGEHTRHACCLWRPRRRQAFQAIPPQFPARAPETTCEGACAPLERSATSEPFS